MKRWGTGERGTPCLTANEDRKPIERHKVLCHQVVETKGLGGALMEAVSVETDVVLIAVCLYLYI